MKTLEGREQENLYDGEGLRAGLREDGKYTTFLYHDGEILTEGDGDSMPVRRHIRGVGLSHVQDLKDGGYHTYHQDEQGSTAYITGADDRAENCYWYDAFGSLLEKREGMRNRILYTGQQYDQATGQYYLRARYYNPVVGRFLQEDTYRGDGLNLYAYCADNPVGYYDPSGHISMESCPLGTTAGQERTKAGETQATITGKDVHRRRADARRSSGEFDSVNEKIKDSEGNIIKVPKSVSKKTGKVSTNMQGVIPDAVKGPNKGGVIIDDKPKGRPISKDYQEIRRNVEAYKEKYGVEPNKIIIERYDPITGEDAGGEVYSLFDIFHK